MKIVKGGRKLFLAFSLASLALLATAVLALAEKTVVYNKYNIHVQDQIDQRGNHRLDASYANYTDPGAGHLIIPPGTPLVVEKASRKGIVFRNQKDDTRFHFEYHEQRMGMSVEEYLKRITSPQPVSLKNLSQEDRKGIAAGKAFPGMSKEGVLTALGHPAAHRTPSLDETTWIYWTNRFATVAVEFNGNGKVINVRR